MCVNYSYVTQLLIEYNHVNEGVMSPYAEAEGSLLYEQTHGKTICECVECREAQIADLQYLILNHTEQAVHLSIQ